MRFLIHFRPHPWVILQWRRFYSTWMAIIRLHAVVLLTLRISRLIRSVLSSIVDVNSWQAHYAVNFRSQSQYDRITYVSSCWMSENRVSNLGNETLYMAAVFRLSESNTSLDLCGRHKTISTSPLRRGLRDTEIGHDAEDSSRILGAALHETSCTFGFND